MAHMFNRRNWLQTTGLLTAGLTTGLSRWQEAKAAFIPESVATEQRLFSEFAALNNLPPDTMPALRARLFANENPYGISGSASAAINKATAVGNRYAWMEFAQLKKLIADAEGVSPKNILITPGSSDVLMAAAVSFSQKGPIPDLSSHLRGPAGTRHQTKRPNPDRARHHRYGLRHGRAESQSPEHAGPEHGLHREPQ